MVRLNDFNLGMVHFTESGAVFPVEEMVDMLDKHMKKSVLLTRQLKAATEQIAFSQSYLEAIRERPSELGGEHF